MTDLLHRPPAIAPLASISPSTFAASPQCLLRVAAQAAFVLPLLPASPRGMFGSVVHRFREKSPGVAATEAALETLWEACEAEIIAKDCNKNPLQSRHLPLSRSINHYTELMWKEIFTAIENGPHTRSSASSGIPSSVRREKIYATSDGAVKGQIDLLIETPEGWIVRDLKTGSIWDEAHPSEIKAIYQTQLRLYAALFYEHEHEWPIGLEIAPTQGEIVSVPFDPAACITLLEEAKASRISWNNQIESAARSSAPEALATPGEHCGYCQFRPACPRYWQAQPTLNQLDIRGVVEGKEALGNGAWRFTLRGEDDQIWDVVLPDNTQLFATGLLDRGQYAEIYSLSSRNAPTLSATRLTLAYVR